MTETTVRHRYHLRDGSEARHVHRFGVESRQHRRLRTVRGLIAACEVHQTDIARQAGISPAHLNRALHGKARVTDTMVDAIAALTQVPRELIRRATSEPLETSVPLNRKVNG